MKISIIVPIYNAERYLEECINSLLRQKHSDIQIILVNDGSTDGSHEICEKFALRDKRILYIVKNNEGLVRARKVGLCNATGDYVGWVDADDWVEADYFSQMAEVQRKTEADIICSVHSHDIGGNSRKVVGKIPVGTYKKEEVLGNMLYAGSFFEFGIQPHVWSKLFRREILMKSQLDIDEGIVCGEDSAVTYPAILAGETICVTDITGYHYVQRQGSMVKTEYLDEELHIKSLIQYLNNKFMEYGVEKILGQQLIQYEKFVLLLRYFQALDKQMSDCGKILMPYGGIEEGSKMIIYGAGVLGQRIYQYLTGNNLAEIALWVDQNYQVYQAQGFQVDDPENIMQEDYDFIVIANSVKTIAVSIREYLIKLNVPRNKIRWLTPWFTDASFKVRKGEAEK